MSGRRLGEKKWRLEIDSDEVLPVRLGHRGKSSGIKGGGVVHQIIEAAKVIDAGIDQNAVAPHVSEVEAKYRGGIRAFGIERLHQLFGFVDGAAAVNRDSDAAAVQTPDDSRADSARASGDQRDG